MINVRIQKIIFFEGYQIEIYLSNGHRIIYDMTSKIKTARFFEIRDFEIFRQAEIIDGRVIHWKDNVEITLEEIINQVMEVKSHREKIVKKQKRR